MEPKLRKELNRIIASLIVFFAMMIIDKTGMLPVVFENRLVSFIVYLVPYFMCGYDVVRKALLGIKIGSRLMNPSSCSSQRSVRL